MIFSLALIDLKFVPKAHALLMSHFHSRLDGWWNLESKRQKLIEEVPVIINELCLMNGLAPGDLPMSTQVMVIFK